MKVSINSRQGSLPMSKKQSKSNKTNVVKPRKVLLLFATPLILVAMIVGGFYIKFQLDVTSAQAGMKEYLQNKYRHEFVVEKPEHKGGGLAVEGHFDAVAYPKDNKTIRFTVMSSSSGVSDGYAGAVWTNSENKRMIPIVHEIFGKNVDIELEIKTFGTSRGDIPVSGAIPSFVDSAEKHGRAILYTLYIKDEDLLRGNEREASGKVFRLLPNLNKHTDLILSYRSQTGDKSYGISLSQDKIKDIKNADDLNKMYKEW